MRDIMQRLNSGILGIQPYQAGKTVSEAARELGLSDFIKLASNENPFGMSPRALNAIKARAAEGFAYPEVSCREARLALAEKLKLDPESIMFGNGGDGLIFACALTMLDDGDETIIPEVTFPYYEIAARAMRARIVFSPVRDLAIDLEDILSRVSRRTKIIWLANPNNPTGLVITRDDFNAFFDRVPDDVFVVYDEVYADFADPSVLPDATGLIAAGRNNLFAIRSFSKIYGLAGVRVGYGIGARELVNAMYRVRPPFDVSVLAQIAAAAAIGDDEFYSLTLAHNEREKAFLYAELEKRSLAALPSSSNFILIDVKRPAAAVNLAMLEKGVIVRSWDKPLLATRLRLTIGTREQNERFLAALDEALRDEARS